MTINAVTPDDMVSHSLFIGATGAGKTNAMLYWMHRLFTERDDVALVLVDPHGDAAIDLVRVIPKSQRGRITILDPEHVSFGLNPLSLPPGVQGQNRVETIHRQVEQLSALLSDVFNTDVASAPRLMWIFKGALYYLYYLPHDSPTFKDLYRILCDFIALPKYQIETMLRAVNLEDQIIRCTIDAISKLEKDAFLSVINRISNFVLPPHSLTSRTFCTRTSRLDVEEMTAPGRLTIFRITKSLPYDFRRLISAAIVMRFYFEVEKRASRLERAGEAPAARTPIILAIDEFQNISDLKLLDTILSESRKYGLHLWIVNQNIQQIRPELYSSICGNVGPIFAFRVGPDDASKMAELISPHLKKELTTDLTDRRDYTCVARMRPHGEASVRRLPLLFEPFPKLREPLCGMKEVIEYMRNEMEERYGGAQEAMEVIYKTPWEQIAEATAGGAGHSSSDRVPFSPIHWKILTTGYLKLLSDVYALEFSRLRSELYQKYSWKTSIVQQAVNDLVNSGFLTQVFGPQEYVREGKDSFGNPIWVALGDSADKDKIDRAKTVIYSLTPRALEWFRLRPGPSKVGDVKHVRIIEKLLKEEYWLQGYYCVVDWGETSKERPDIAVLMPAVMTTEDAENGNLPQRIPNPYVWDYTSAKAVEIEMSPEKSRVQLRKNYEKNKRFYSTIRFVVTSDDHKEQLLRILGEDPPADPAKFVVDVIPFESLNVIAPPEIEMAAEVESTQREPSPTLGKPDEFILSFIVNNGFTSREDIAEKCNQSGVRISVRSVSRYLKLLTEEGMLRRERNNGYAPTDAGKKRAGQQGTL